MADFGGLIGGIMKGFGAGLEQVGQVELKKQSEMDLRKQMLEMESEKRLREDEVRRERDLAYIPKTAEATAKSKLATAPIEAQANVAGETAKFEAEKKGNLPQLRAEAGVASETAKFEAEKKGNLPQLRAEAGVASETAKFEAEKKGNLPQLRATAKATETVAELEARNELEVARKQAEADADKRAQELKAEKDKGITKLEAERTARVEKEKYEAMISAGVPKAKADALMADYIAGDPLRKKQAEDAINAEISKVKKLSENKDYLKGTSKIKVAESAGDIAEINAREAARNRTDKKERARNTIEMERQIKETNNEIGRIIGIGDPKKIPDELSYLESQAKKGNKDAVEKLAKIKPLVDELNNLSRELRSYKRGSSDAGSSSEKTAYKIGETRTIASGENKGKTVEWDGNGWVLKK